jgi:hypothetical protein
MDNQTIAGMIQQYAPGLAAALTGPAASTALAALGGSLLQDQAASPEDIAAEMTAAKPDLKANVQRAEQEFNKLQASAGASVAAPQPDTKAQDGVGDNGGAPALDPEAKARHRQSKWNDIAAATLAIGVTLGFFALLFLLVAQPGVSKDGTIPPFHDLLQTLLGVLGTGWAGIIGYYFGSSVGSKEKNSILAERANPAPTAAPAAAPAAAPSSSGS